MIRTGSALGSVRRRVWVLNASRGSQINTQRNGAASKPVLRQTAVSETTSTERFSLLYQVATMLGFQSVEGSSVAIERFARHSPLDEPVLTAQDSVASWLIEHGVQLQASDKSARLDSLW